MGATPWSKREGFAKEDWDWAYVFVRGAWTAIVNQSVTSHEAIGHQFGTNGCTNLVDPCGSGKLLSAHDSRRWWKWGGNGGCLSPVACLMYPDTGPASLQNGIHRFCVEDLLLGDPTNPCADRENTTLRKGVDPK